MKAIVQDKYGPSDVLHVGDIDKPVPKDDEVLVRVQAAGIHIGDWMLMMGTPYIMRIGAGLRKPRKSVPGFDVSGTVEAVGKNVNGFERGDEVFGDCNGSCAEYVSVAEKKLVLKPEELSFEQAAAVPVSGVTALRGIRDAGKVKPGQKILINGASGGVGTLAVQIAKSLGAEVTGVCSTGNVEMVRSLGADHVIDYTKGDFTQGDERYDLILDNVANHSLADCRRALTPTGTLLPNSGRSDGRWFGAFGRMVKAMLVSPFVRQQGRPFVAPVKKKDLVDLVELVEAGKLTPVIDRTYPLSETAAAMAYVGRGHVSGKTVITL
ncbi:MAG: NAD(P)-dependent alcohol dehydrogenase [Actinomycetota bacterium]|nr:NAD(P)-dependent alcohol dehydrogenase [Actinomycetota bacterium]